MATESPSCTIRCLRADDVRHAKDAAAGTGAIKVPFTCSISGKQEDLILLSDAVAACLSDRFPRWGVADTWKILAALTFSGLCECDIATLVERDEGEVCDELRRLEAEGLLGHRKIRGMNYFALADADVKRCIQEAVDPK